MRLVFVLLISIASFSACQSNQPATEGTVTTADSLVVDLHPLPEIRSVDSIDMHFFKDISDQKIYTRIGVNDTAVVRLFTSQEMMHSFVSNPPCEYDTKFFCFSKGQVIKTLYIAAQNDSCRFIGFIKSGGIAVKIAMSDSAATIVNNFRKKSQ